MLILAGSGIAICWLVDMFPYRLVGRLVEPVVTGDGELVGVIVDDEGFAIGSESLIVTPLGDGRPTLYNLPLTQLVAVDVSTRFDVPVMLTLAEIEGAAGKSGRLGLRAARFVRLGLVCVSWGSLAGVFFLFRKRLRSLSSVIQFAVA